MAILVVEDERDLNDLLTFILRRAGHDVISAYDGESAIQMWREQNPQLVLLDVGIPQKSGWDVCRAIRSESTTPIMIVSGADSEDDMVRGFDLGAMDYVTKPFSPRLLQARIRTMLSRSGPTEMSPGPEMPLTVGDLHLDSHWRTVTCEARSEQLTRTEFRVLQELAWACGQVVSHSELIERVWGYKGEASSNIVKGHIRTVRIKLDTIESRTRIRVVPGVGYIMDLTRQA